MAHAKAFLKSTPHGDISTNRRGLMFGKLFIALVAIAFWSSLGMADNSTTEGVIYRMSLKDPWYFEIQGQDPLKILPEANVVMICRPEYQGATLNEQYNHRTVQVLLEKTRPDHRIGNLPSGAIYVKTIYVDCL